MKNNHTMKLISGIMGYDRSSNFYCFSAIEECKELSIHDKKVLYELKPYAFYIIDGTVLVAFFNDLKQRSEHKIQAKIWNAQIPIIISDEGNVINIYSGRDMQINDIRDIELKMMDTYNRECCDEDMPYSYWNITNQHFLQGIEDQISCKRLNEFLIENLKYITNTLKKDYGIDFANKLILRVLFIRYLIDRGIDIGYLGFSDNIKKSQEVFLKIMRNKDELYELFEYLKVRFNGNLFEMDKSKEMAKLSEEALMLLHDFLGAKENLASKQLCLFPYYDFNIIPVELISNIYEILLGKEKQGKDKAFYTPEFLVDYIIQQTVAPFLAQNEECKVLDPSCGSGIFLVKSLKCLLEKHADTNGFIKDSDLLNDIVTKNIFGVDYNEEAIDVTIFSLYITLFDFQDPKSLDSFRLPLLKEKSIFASDFFIDENLYELKKHKFNFILGNPPWGRVDQKSFQNYCAKCGVILQDKEISIAFILKVKEYADDTTVCSLVLPSKIFYKKKQPSVVIRSKILKSSRILQILELSSVRKLLFKGATAPATVLSFDYKLNEIGQNKLEYISLKPNLYFQIYNLIMIEPYDVKYIEQNLLLQYDWLWKTLVYGTSWDFDILVRLKKGLPVIKDIERKNGLIHGKGIEDHLGDGQDSSHLVGRKILNSDKSIEHFSIDTEKLSVFDKKRIHRARKKELFEPPYVFFKKGADCSNYTIRATYSEEKLIYKSTVSCIKGEEKDSNILKNLAGLLNSTLFSYFNLMLGSSIGIEREQIFLKEIEEYPYIYSKELVELVDKVIRKNQSQNDFFIFEEDTSSITKEINTKVLELYELQDNEFVKYVIDIQIPMLCNNVTVYNNAYYEDLKAYADTFIKSWIYRLESEKLFVQVKLYPDIKRRFTAFELVIKEEEPEEDIIFIYNYDEVELLTKFMLVKVNDLFYQTKNIIEFQENSFFIVKTNDVKNWHPAMAIIDSSEVLNTIFLAEEDV